MAWEADYCVDFIPEYITLKFRKIVCETEKAILFDKNGKHGFWLPKSLIVEIREKRKKKVVFESYHDWLPKKILLYDSGIFD